MFSSGCLSKFFLASRIVLILTLCVSATPQSTRTLSGRVVDLEFRADFFDLFNHANFGQPGVVGSPAFRRITNTRFPTGESRSSRQVQLGMNLSL